MKITIPQTKGVSGFKINLLEAKKVELPISTEAPPPYQEQVGAVATAKNKKITIKIESEQEQDSLGRICSWALVLMVNYMLINGLIFLIIYYTTLPEEYQ